MSIKPLKRKKNYPFKSAFDICPLNIFNRDRYKADCSHMVTYLKDHMAYVSKFNYMYLEQIKSVKPTDLSYLGRWDAIWRSYSSITKHNGYVHVYRNQALSSFYPKEWLNIYKEYTNNFGGPIYSDHITQTNVYIRGVVPIYALTYRKEYSYK